ncbi:MAG: MBL fold metallo-hydrolase [Planctomycetota bacterium]
MLQLGPWQIDLVETGTLALDGGAMFGVVPKTLWQRLIPADDRNRIRLAARSLLIRGNSRIIVVDTGCGHKWNPKLQEIYGIEFESGDLLPNLAKLGVEAKQVSDVINTHFHFDHAGGNTFRDGAELRPTFPNARYHVQRENWDNACMPNARERASYLSENWEVLQDTGKLHMLDFAGDVFPGIEVERIDGHTHGQQTVRIHVGERSLWFPSDNIPTFAHVPIPWVMGYDMHALQSMREKEAFLERAAAEQWIVVYQHGVAKPATLIEKTDKGFQAGAEVAV